ncbi:MAG: C_GCAxxG_C_C family protein [Acidobacteria bacterium]|nr:C_GCAxxG_C_C family protein [Acidobacteriota bacterium]
MSVSEKYRGLSREGLLEQAYALGVAFEAMSGSCSQCTVAALHEILGFDEAVVRIASSSCGGHASFSAGTCGAVVGGTMVLDWYFGRPAPLLSAEREIPGGHEALESAIEKASRLCGRFLGRYGSLLCPGVQEKLYGRSYNLKDPSEWEAFMQAGAHSDPTKCMSVVGNAARWTLEILLEEGAVAP